MLNNYFTIKETARYLNDNISGYFIRDIYTQEKNKLLIEIDRNGNNDVKLLEFSIERGFNYLVIKNNYSKAKKNFAGLFENACGKLIERAEIFNDDRVISFVLGEDTKIIFTFFSNKSNSYLTVGKSVIDSFKDKIEFSGKSIAEIIPSMDQKLNSITSHESIGKYAKQIYRKYGDLYISEVLIGNNLSGQESASAENIAVVDEAFLRLNQVLNSPRFLIYTNDKVFILSLITLSHLEGFSFKTFDNINELVAEYISLKFRIEKTDLLKNRAQSEIEQKISNIEKKIKGIKIQLRHCEDSDSLKDLGNIILQNIHLITKGDKEFSFISEEGETIVIKLKEDLTPSENAGAYFDKYKKQKNSVEVLKKRIESFIIEKSRLTSELERINKLTEYKTLLKEEKKSEVNKNDETSVFRKFRLNDKYEVWVGKDSASNDLLTTKYAAQNDFWFHVRGVSGSHTVLKVNNKKDVVEKDILNRAASIAAYYSKARNASSVPVAYCEKKYVKKKKGFRQGSVIMEREKVVFVKPALPE